MKTESHQVPPLDRPTRLSDYAGGIFKLIPTRKGMKKAIDRGWVSINGKRAATGDFISGGEIIKLTLEKAKPRPSIALKLEVLYEDEFLAIINKPAGIEVSGNRKWTIENALAGNLKPSTQEDGLEFPEAIHRLDHPTTGALLIGKTRTAVAELNRLFSERAIGKTYLAIAIGEMNDSGTITSNVDEKPSRSEYKVLESVASERFGQLNLVELKPHTGRRHQLRKHLASIGNPILGDKDHGIDGLILKGKGLYLHSFSLEFTHPFKQEILKVSAPIPTRFEKIFPRKESD